MLALEPPEPVAEEVIGHGLRVPTGRHDVRRGCSPRDKRPPTGRLRPRNSLIPRELKKIRYLQAEDGSMSTPRIVLLLFLLAQACDGLFTYTAVSAYGLHAEGNVLIATWMGLVGPGAALFGAKFVAAACGVLLYARNAYRTLAILTALYAFGAIGPWMV